MAEKKGIEKYVRVAEDAKYEEKKQINDRVTKGELVFAYYAIDGNKGYHYYEIINKK